MRNFAFLLFGIIAPFIALSQSRTVYFNYERSQFGDGEKLPAESYLVFTGEVIDEISLVEIELRDFKSNASKKPLHKSSWKRNDFNNDNNNFIIPFNYRLKENHEYDFKVMYYKELNLAEKQILYNLISKTTINHINNNLKLTHNKLSLTKSAKDLIKELDEVIEQGFKLHKFDNIVSYDGLSNIVLDRLEQIQALSKSEVKHTNTQIDYIRDSLSNELAEMIQIELSPIFNATLYELYDVKNIENYLTEDKKGYFSVIVGYSAAYIDFDSDNPSEAYAHAPMLGIGFPLAKSTLAPNLLQNTNLSVGFFLKDFVLENGNTYTGPVVNKPIYAGLDFKLFQFVRFNAGATLLEENFNNREILVRPFVGLSAKINISLFLDK